MSHTPKPRWDFARFGGCVDLRVGRRWIGQVEPRIGGPYRYSGWACRGRAASFAEAKRAVEASADLPDAPLSRRVREMLARCGEAA